MSKTLARWLDGMVRAATAGLRPKRRQATLALLAERLAQEVVVRSPAGAFRVVCPSARALHDPLGFGVDEPETVAWICALPPGAVVWDIGANIGLYSLLAAARGLRVLAFEPSAASFAALVRNVEVNGWGERVSAYCLAFGAAEGLGALHMAATSAGHSMHSLDGAATIEGEVRVAFRQAVPAFSVDGFCRVFGVAPPDYVKLDVDGLEAVILAGAAETLRGVRAVLVEIDGAEREAGGGAVRGALALAGFVEAAGVAGARNVVFRRVQHGTRGA